MPLYSSWSQLDTENFTFWAGLYFLLRSKDLIFLHVGHNNQNNVIELLAVCLLANFCAVAVEDISISVATLY